MDTTQNPDRFTTCLVSVPHDMRLFQNERGVLSLCDRSGTSPETTDDGPLILTPGCQVERHFLKNRQEIVFIVPVHVTRTNEPGAVWLGVEAMRRMRDAFAPVIVSTPEFRQMYSVVAETAGW